MGFNMTGLKYVVKEIENIKNIDLENDELFSKPVEFWLMKM